MIRTYIEINADADNPQEIAEAVKLANQFGGAFGIAIVNGIVTLTRAGSVPSHTYETWITDEEDSEK